MKQCVERVPSGHKARIRFDDGRTRSKTHPTAKEARSWIRRTLTELADGTHVPESAGRIKFAEWAEHYMAGALDLAPGTRNRRRSDLNNWIIPAFGHRPIGAITQPEVQAWVSKMANEGCNAGSIKLRYESLGTILRRAVEADMLRRSPCHDVRLPRYERDQMRLLTLGQVVRLSEAIHAQYRPLVLLAGTAGLRMGELAALRGRRIDFHRGTVDVVENLTLDNGKPIFGPLKSRASRRRVPLPRQTVQALLDHYDRFAIDDDDLLFTSTQGQVMRYYQFRRRYFAPAAEKAGLAPLRPHDLRHTAISLWIASGANAKVVQTKAGHASIRVTYDRYGHLFPDYDDKATKHLEEMWGALDEATPRLRIVRGGPVT